MRDAIRESWRTSSQIALVLYPPHLPPQYRQTSTVTRAVLRWVFSGEEQVEPGQTHLGRGVNTQTLCWVLFSPALLQVGNMAVTVSFSSHQRMGHRCYGGAVGGACDRPEVIRDGFLS